MKKPNNFKIWTGPLQKTEFEVSDAQDRALIYFKVSPLGETPDYFWIENMRMIRRLHAWLGRVIKYYETRES